ncbi:MAG: prepilin-type N-terminal cleavage/methylation domain-containing protein [Minisyncoccia bacterium]
MNKSQKGFTLIELLVVIALIAVLAVAVVLALNPAELLKQGRDSTRTSDLASINSALSLYLADVSSPSLGNNANCYVHASSSANCSSIFAGSPTTTSTSSQAINGTGWIPVNLTAISSGAPLPKYPIDPTNNATYFYAYRPGPAASSTYKITAVLESGKYKPQAATDGGTSSTVYEVGNDLSL